MRRLYPDPPVPRRAAYRSVPALQRDCRACVACVEEGHPVLSLPVFEGHVGQAAILIGQSPGAVEGIDGRPWRGRAGRTLRGWLALDEDAFRQAFYCCSVTRCYPGRSRGGRGDRIPTREELDLCSFWLEQELRLLRPQLVVTVGGLAARRVLGLTALTAHVGERLQLGPAVAVPLPHPSGASGWTNLAGNRERLARALEFVKEELERLSG